MERRTTTAPNMMFLLMSIPGSQASTPYTTSLDYSAVNDASTFRFSSTFLMLCLFLFGFLCTQPKKTRETSSRDVCSTLDMNIPMEIVSKTKRDVPQMGHATDRLHSLPQETSLQIFTFLDAKSLATCSLVSTGWSELVGESNSKLWQALFLRDFEEDGSRFNAPCGLEWRMYYFTHRVTRPIERMRLLIADGMDCIVVNKVVYNVGPFLYLHPGGHRVIADVLGTDATATWLEFEHSTNALTYMKDLAIQDEIQLSIPGTIAQVLRTKWSHLGRHANVVATLFEYIRRCFLVSS